MSLILVSDFSRPMAAKVEDIEEEEELIEDETAALCTHICKLILKKMKSSMHPWF
jgi:hypothetical protein